MSHKRSHPRSMSLRKKLSLWIRLPHLNTPYRPIRFRNQSNPPPTSLLQKKSIHADPVWYTKFLCRWNIEKGISTSFEIGQSTRVPPPPTTNNCHSTMPLLVARSANLEHQIRTVSDELSIIENNIVFISRRVQNIE